jgi:hypothetical protein
MGVIHIHAPMPIGKHVHSGTCPDCKRRSRFIGWSYEWYGASNTCLRCGREWQDGEWMPLPFMRGARQHNIDAAKRRFRAIGATP